MIDERQETGYMRRQETKDKRQETNGKRLKVRGKRYEGLER